MARKPAAHAPRGARGDNTRSQLIEAGMRLFGQHDFESVSTRDLAREAGVNLAAITYHFGGKKELYRAILETLVAETEPLIGPAMAELRTGIQGADGDKAQLARLASGFVTGLLKAFVPGQRARWRAALVMREYANPSDAFPILFEGRIEPLHKTACLLAAAATNRSPEDEDSIILAHAVMGQIFVFAIARVVLFKRMGWDSYTPERLEEITRIVIPSFLGSLGLPVPAERNPRP